MTHQALTTYRALLDAAAVAPGAREDNPECLPARIVIRTGDRSSMTVRNTRERLQELADHVRKHWGLYGGGPKPDEIKPKARKASTWPAGLVRCWLGQIQDQDHAGAMLTAEQLGGWYALVGNTPDSHARAFVAPQHVEGMPDRIVSACRDDGRWVVMDRLSGQTVCNQKARSRASAEADALARLQEMAERRSTTPEAFLSDALARVQPAADGLDQWRKRWGLVEVAPVVADPAPVVAEVADPAPVAAVLDQVQPLPDVAPGYSLPEHVYEDWRGAEGLAFVPSDRQRIVLQAVERALSEGLYYSTDILARCAELLQPSDADRARGVGKVEGGYFGMDLYYARCSIKAKKRHQEQAETLRALRPTVGDVYGVLVFNDYKVSRACKVEEVSEEGNIVLSLCRGARPGWRVTVSAVQIAYAMDRAHEKGARRGGWKEWMAAHPVPEEAPVLDQAQHVAPVVADHAPVAAVVADPAHVAAVLDQAQPLPDVAPDVAPVLDQVQPAPMPLRSSQPFRPALSHWRNTRQGAIRHRAGAWIGRFRASQHAGAGPGGHPIGHPIGHPAAPAQGPGAGARMALDVRHAGPAPARQAPSAGHAQGSGEGAAQGSRPPPGAGPDGMGRPGSQGRRRAPADPAGVRTHPPGCRGQCGRCARALPPGCRGQCALARAWPTSAPRPRRIPSASSWGSLLAPIVSLLAPLVSLPGWRIAPPFHQEIDP